MAYFKNINLIKVIKIAVGTGLAIFIAGIFGLNHSASAGIITLLSIQDTKKNHNKDCSKKDCRIRAGHVDFPCRIYFIRI